MTKIMESLNQAIEDYNNYNGPACIYYNQNDHYYSALVFLNDIDATQTMLNDTCFAITSKHELEGNTQIDELGKEYVQDFVKLVKDGYEPFQVDFHLRNKYPRYIFINM